MDSQVIMLGYSGDFSQGWVLTILSSVLCVAGCFIIYLDDIYYLVFPRWLTSRYPFHLKENYSFMNGSLAFSSGCLLLTALYRLLPEAMLHLKESEKSSNENRVLIFSFIVGILTCVAFNEALHFFTAESVVHCSHDGEDKVAQIPYTDLERGESGNLKNYGSAEYNHEGHSEHEDPEGHGSHIHHHTENHHYHDDGDDLGPTDVGSGPYTSNRTNDGGDYISHQEENSLESPSSSHDDAADGDRAPLLGRRKSSRFIHYFSQATEDPRLLGECKGYTSAELCLHRGNDLHFCEIPELASPDKALENESDSSNTVSEVCDTNPLDLHKTDSAGHSHHHLHTASRPHLHADLLSRLVHSHSHLDDHSHHLSNEHHHHHVNLPLSRLLLIGVQTILAITLHKFPEGFITYITSETNPELGVLIFLSLLIHNYTEGFSMCLPLYYSFPASARWRKLKAVSVSALLGGLSQPLGAFGGYLFMRYYAHGSFDIGKLDEVFGISMAVTSGFLVVIALSMYGSAVSFSALPNFVMLWCLMGMSVIGLLTVFTSKN